MSFWCPFLDPHLTTYHSNIGVHILAMLDLGMSRENQAYKEKKKKKKNIIWFDMFDLVQQWKILLY